MKKLFSMIAGMVLAMAAFHASADGDKATPRDAEAMVKKSIVFYQKNGREKSLAEFSKMPGPFVDRDVYVTVYNDKGDCLSHINPKMVNKNMIDLRDADGKFHIKDRIEASHKAASGWQDITFFNPVSKKIEPKRIYWERYDNLVFAAGAYKPEK